MVVSGLLFGLLIGRIVFSSALAGFGSQRLPPTVGNPSPDFTLYQIDDSSVQLSKLRGTPVIINFWATWCPPCVDEMPLLEQTANAHAGQLIVLGVNAGEPPEQVLPFLLQTGVTFPVVLDQNEEVTDLYFVRNFPMTFFVDAEGIIRAQHTGAVHEGLLSRYLKTIGIEP